MVSAGVGAIEADRALALVLGLADPSLISRFVGLPLGEGKGIGEGWPLLQGAMVLEAAAPLERLRGALGVAAGVPIKCSEIALGSTVGTGSFSGAGGGGGGGLGLVAGGSPTP